MSQELAFVPSQEKLKSFIPIPPSPIVGREKEIAELVELLKKNRVVTITGTGGIGKTRIAVEICHQIGNSIPEEIIYASMSTLAGTQQVMPVVAHILGIAESLHVPGDRVAEILFAKKVLLVLDNLEHIQSAPTEIADLITTCPHVRVFCTSRTPLKIRAEQEYPLQTLPVPDQIPFERILHFPAVELFVNRIKKINKDFELTPENYSTIIKICKWLDGLPLALELAASRLRILAPDQLLARLSNTLNLLTSENSDLPIRHQTLRNTVDWSYELLNKPEKKLFRRLGIFAKGFSLEAIEAICYDTDDTRKFSIEEVESLVDSSLVQKIYTTNRFGLLQTIRDFASEKLIDTDEYQSVAWKHAQYYHEISKIISEGTQGVQQPERMNLGILDEPNIFVALDYLLEQSLNHNEEAQEMGLQLCGNLWTFWHIQGRHTTAKKYINALLSAIDSQKPTIGKCDALFCLHVACFTLGEIDQSREAAERLLAMATALNNELEIVKGSFGQGFGNMFTDLEKALAHNAETVDRSRKFNNAYWLGLALWQKGVLNLNAGNAQQAKESYTEALEIFQALDENEGIGISQSGLCMLEFMVGNYERALELYSSALFAFEVVGDRPEQARTLGEMAWTYLANGDTNTALQYALDSITVHQEIGSDRGVGISMNALAAIEAVKNHPGKAVEIAAAAQYFADKKGVAIELGVNNHGEVYLRNAKKKLSSLEIEQSEKTGRNSSIKSILEYARKNFIAPSETPVEDTFLVQLGEAIERNLEDSSFGVNQLYDAVSMSQMQVYRKLKASTNQTPSQFIRTYRLKKGKELLKSTDKTISEIAYAVGFTDPNYFSRTFYKEFLQTPSEYRT